MCGYGMYAGKCNCKWSVVSVSRGTGEGALNVPCAGNVARLARMPPACRCDQLAAQNKQLLATCENLSTQLAAAGSAGAAAATGAVAGMDTAAARHAEVGFTGFTCAP